MGVLYNNQLCLDPRSFRADCLRLGLPTDWLGKPSSYSCPLGPTSGQGWILLSRASLDAIDTSIAHDLVFEIANSVTGTSTSVTLKNLSVVWARNLCPAERDADKSTYLVELCDPRYFAAALPSEVAYNLRAAPGHATGYFSATLLSGVAFTWQQMAEEIWTALADWLGPYPAIPFTPEGVPENFDFYGGYMLDALDCVLTRVGCALAYDPVAGTFGITRLSYPDTVADRALAAHDCPDRIWDVEPVEPWRSRVPEKVRVRFRKSWTGTPPIDGQSPHYNLDRTDTETALETVEEGACVIVPDDMEALYDYTGTLSNAAALGTRADERASDYFRKARLGRLGRTYAGAQGGEQTDESIGLLPGAQVQTTEWHDRGDGFGTSTSLMRPLRVGRFGTIEGMDDGASERARPAWVIQPGHEMQLVRVSSLTPTDGRYPGYVRGQDAAGNSADRYECWVRMHNGATPELLTYSGRFLDWQTDRPVYAVDLAPRLNVQEVDGTPSYSDITQIRFDQADGFVLTQPSAGVVRVDLSLALTISVTGFDANGDPLLTVASTTALYVNDPLYVTDETGGVAGLFVYEASETQAGVVSIGDQNFVGDKRFYDTVYFGPTDILTIQGDSGILNIAGGDIFTVGSVSISGHNGSGQGNSIQVEGDQIVFTGTTAGQLTLQVNDGGSVSTGQSSTQAGMVFVCGLFVSGSFSLPGGSGLTGTLGGS